MKHISLLFTALLFSAFAMADVPAGYAIYGDVPSGYTDLTSNVSLGDWGGGYDGFTTDHIKYTGKGLGDNVGEGNYLRLSFSAAQVLQLETSYKIHIVIKKGESSANNVQFSFCRSWNSNRAGKTIPAASLSTDYQEIVLSNSDLTESTYGAVRSGAETPFNAGEHFMRFCAVNDEVIHISQIYIENVFTPFQQSANLGILCVKNLPLYDHAGSHMPNIGNGERKHINFYVVSVNQDTYYRQVAIDGTFDGNNNYDNQLLTWTSAPSANKEIYRAAKTDTEAYSDYSVANLNGLWGIGDNVACYVSACAKMWGHSHLYSALLDFRGTYVCTPTGDQTAPTATAVARYNGANYTVTFTASDNSGELFYYVVNETRSTKQISFIPSFVLSGASEGDVFTCYAVDFNGNMSAPFRVAAMNCDNCFLVQ